MLEPTEPNEGSELNTPSDTLPPRRRRRAASRPAGPPSGAEAPTEVTEPAIPAAEADEITEAEEKARAEEKAKAESIASLFGGSGVERFGGCELSKAVLLKRRENG
ncbi:hypothetical protein, partial [Streptomyces collinus]